MCFDGKLAAIKAIEAGVAGIIVSNHGARQLDYTPTTFSVLEEVIPLNFRSEMQAHFEILFN